MAGENLQAAPSWSPPGWKRRFQKPPAPPTCRAFSPCGGGEADSILRTTYHEPHVNISALHPQPSLSSEAFVPIIQMEALRLDSVRNSARVVPLTLVSEHKAHALGREHRKSSPGETAVRCGGILRVSKTREAPWGKAWYRMTAPRRGLRPNPRRLWISQAMQQGYLLIDC